MTYAHTRNSKLAPYSAFISTPSCCCAVAEEWLLLFLITAAALFFGNYFLWYGFLFGFTFHLVVLHLVLGNFFRRYVPGVFTAALFLLPSVYMLFYSARDLHYGWQTATLSALAGTIIAMANLRLVHWAMPVFARWIDCFRRKGVRKPASRQWRCLFALRRLALSQARKPPKGTQIRDFNHDETKVIL